MKTNLRYYILVLSLIGFSFRAFAQISGSANAFATIVTPIELTKSLDMNFGNVAGSSSDGTVVLTPDGSRSATGGVTLPTISGTVTAASFIVTGVPDYTYSITLPANLLNITFGSNNMTVNVFASNPAVNGTLNASGSQTINVGATLNVLASQSAGFYTSVSPFTITVNYN